MPGSVLVHFTMPLEEKEKLKELAKELDCSMSDLIRRGIELVFREHETKKKRRAQRKGRAKKSKSNEQG